MFLISDKIFAVCLENLSCLTRSWQNWPAQGTNLSFSVKWHNVWPSWRTTWIGNKCHISVWMVPLRLTIDQICWRSSIPKIHHTWCFCWVQGLVVLDWIYNLLILSSSLIVIGILTRYVNLQTSKSKTLNKNIKALLKYKKQNKFQWVIIWWFSWYYFWVQSRKFIFVSKAIITSSYSLRYSLSDS